MSLSPLRQLPPSLLWNSFVDLNAVPRPSKKEDRVVEFVRQFALQHGLEFLLDEVGNAIIKKPASAGRSGRPAVILQAHLDMVHTQDAGRNFDFDTQGIQMKIEGDWVTAEGTTLGADNGLGVAAIMAVLASPDLEHPPVEALLTIDEEQGMTGAAGLQSGLLSGTTLLNLDSEEDHVFTIGCAGGMDTEVRYSYAESACPPDAERFEISITGLLGGHSGLRIHEGRANAIKLMTRILLACENQGVSLSSMLGGNARNAIPAECRAEVVVADPAVFKSTLARVSAEIGAEFRHIETSLRISTEPRPFLEVSCMEAECQSQLLLAFTAATNGVFRMSPDVPGLVEASSNFAQVKIGQGEGWWCGLQRSSVESSKHDVAATFAAPFQLLPGTDVSTDHDYPGWEPKSDSAILHKMADIYRRLFAAEVGVGACHAGLECGLISKAYPGLDMISFGPNIEEAHSTAERASISSSQKFWKLLVTVLSEM